MHTRMRMLIRMRNRIRIHMCMCMHIQMIICICMHMCLCMHIHTCMYICMRMCVLMGWAAAAGRGGGVCAGREFRNNRLHKHPSAVVAFIVVGSTTMVEPRSDPRLSLDLDVSLIHLFRSSTSEFPALRLLVA